jgi:molecular chaperone GrpE
VALLEGQITEIRQAHAEAAAEFEKSKERLERNQGEESARAKLNFAVRFFEVADNLDRMVKFAETSHAGDAFVSGVAMVRDDFFSALEEFHVLRIEPAGKTFDPTRHEAVERRGSSREQHNQVLEVIAPGYIAGDRVLRVAQVVVGQFNSK